MSAKLTNDERDFRSRLIIQALNFYVNKNVAPAVAWEHVCNKYDINPEKFKHVFDCCKNSFEKICMCITNRTDVGDIDRAISDYLGIYSGEADPRIREYKSKRKNKEYFNRLNKNKK